MDSTTALVDLPIGFLRDDKYYFPDGDVTILVLKTLFRVHKRVLARDGSAFENMFALDSGMDLEKAGSHLQVGQTQPEDFVQDGGDDEHPVMMQGDDVEEFRDLLWALYALPHEIAEAMSPKSEAAILKLANVAQLANKYHFLTTELWALRSLSTFFRTELQTANGQAQTPAQAKGQGQVQPIPLSTTALVKVTEVAALCEGREENNILLDALRPKWKALIHSRKDLGLAVNVTERLGIRDLCGLAYYSILLQGHHSWEQDPHLTREHRIRLLSGYHALTQFCDSLPTSPPSFAHHPNCIDGPEECNRAWKAFWRSMMSLDPEVGVGSIAIRHEKLDVLGRLMMAVSIMQTLEEGALHTTGGHPFEECDECHRPAMLATVGVCRKMQDELMDFFPEVV